MKESDGGGISKKKNLSKTKLFVVSIPPDLLSPCPSHSSNGKSIIQGLLRPKTGTSAFSTFFSHYPYPENRIGSTFKVNPEFDGFSHLMLLSRTKPPSSLTYIIEKIYKWFPCFLPPLLPYSLFFT